MTEDQAGPDKRAAEQGADQPQSATAQAEKAPVKKEVKVDGDVPESLLGRWLVLSTLNLPNGAAGDPSLLEIARAADGKVNFDHRTRNLPAELLDEVKTANKTGQGFTPSKELLGRLASSWSESSPDVAGPVRGLEYWFVTPAHYTDEIKAEENARDAKAVLVVSRFPVAPPGGRAPVRTDLFFFFKDLAPERASGPHINFQLVAAFAPVPVTLHGEFTAYRIGGGPPPGDGPAPAGRTGSAAQKKSPG